MDAREWNATMARIESTPFEMRDLLKNESRRWATYTTIFSTPPAAASPQPTSAPVPSPPPFTPSPAIATLPQTATEQPPKTKPSPEMFTPPPKQTHLSSPLDPTPIRPIPMNLHDQKYDFHQTCYAKQKPSLPMFLMPSTHTHGIFEKDDHHMQKQTIMLPSPPSYGIDIGPSQPCLYKDHFHVNSEATIANFGWKREWRPPWSLMTTAPNATVRVEWRPPWFPPSCIRTFALRTRRVRAGWNVMCRILGHDDLAKPSNPRAMTTVT